MRGNYDGFLLLTEISHDQFVPQPGTDVGINGRKWIIKNKNVRIRINSTSQGYSRFLTTGESDTLSSNFGQVTSWKLVEIRNQTAKIGDSIIFFLVERIPESDVLSNGFAENARLLRKVSQFSIDQDRWFLLGDHIRLLQDVVIIVD